MTPQITRAKATIARLGIEQDYPFPPNFVRTPQGFMHYVDQGSGDPVLLLHGNPTWSFLYRKFIPALSDTARVIAPDHIGFGLSDKPSDEAVFSIAAHIENLCALVTELDLKNITLVMQDWGGPTGLGMAARFPDRISKLVILNTFGFYPPAEGIDPENLKLPAPLRLMRHRGIGDYLVRRLGFFDRVVMRLATANRRELRRIHHAYTDVFDGAPGRAGVMAFPRLIPTNTKHPSARIMIEETEPFLDAFQGPVQIFWGMKDPLFPNAVLDAWAKKFPEAQVTRLPQGKHYIQEDAPEVIIPALRTFLAA